MKKIVWKRLWARRYSPFLASAFLFSFLKNKQYGLAPNKMFVPEGNLTASYWEEREFKNLAENYEKFLKKQDIKKYAIEYEKKFQGFLLYSKKLSKINLDKYSTIKIRQLVKEFIDKQIDISDLQFCAFLVLEGPAARLENYFAKLPEGQKFLQWITTPYKETKIVKSHIELLNLAKNYRQRKLRKYAEKYAWIPIYEFLDKPWDWIDFANQIKSIKSSEQELVTYRKNKTLAKKNYVKYFKSIKNRQIKQTAEIVHVFSYLKEMRDDYRRHAYYLLQPFLKQIAQRLNISFTELNYLSVNELLESIEKGKSVVSKSEFLKRQKAYALILKNKKIIILSGVHATQLGLKMQKSGETKIKGFVASKGFVKGKVKVVYHQGEFNKFKNGEILVTTMTHPEFLQIMKKAKAIVTDEGGITCHAAIVSRELGIPCIIGTKNATRVLKDGDIVEVDANKGIVRKV